jgi:hypothetical protein
MGGRKGGGVVVRGSACFLIADPGPDPNANPELDPFPDPGLDDQILKKKFTAGNF